MATATYQEPGTSEPAPEAPCPVCLEDIAFRGGAHIFTCGRCGVRFHYACVLQWEKSSCPCCRVEIPRPPQAAPEIALIFTGRAFHEDVAPGTWAERVRLAADRARMHRAADAVSMQRQLEGMVNHMEAVLAVRRPQPPPPPARAAPVPPPAPVPAVAMGYPQPAVAGEAVAPRTPVERPPRRRLQNAALRRRADPGAAMQADVAGGAAMQADVTHTRPS